MALSRPKTAKSHSTVPLTTRATAALLLSRGKHPKLVQELLGQANISITLDTYSHILLRMGDQAAAAMEDALL